MPPLPYLLLAALLGLLFGSFLNVLIARLPLGESIVTPRSHCPTCGHPIRWFDNLPVLSYFLLRARCRDCGTPIPWRYPAVELLTALWFTLAAHLALTHLSLHAAGQISGSHLAVLLLGDLAQATLILFLLPLAVIDWRTQLLPDVLTLTGALIGLLFTCAQAVFLPVGAYDLHFTSRRMRLRSPGSFIARGDVFLTGTERVVYGRAAAIVGAFLLLILIRWLYKALRKREGMGLGDAKLLACIAAFLGFESALLSLFVGVLAASLFAITLVSTGRAHRLTRLPFGSFLAAAALVSALWGEPLLNWYKSLLQ